ncbi:hypothetical protein [Kitasatospora sp. A2-31]|uniref:pPIWI_RE_Y domain-containing protein n=1 Tax=Kitasatospora sp. A2-31 TaxID=2916414 RepID=UPI001EEC656C|nr:hypothetical protein [Kitasatospora sp. A2-31]MCG6495702.1 hypothetical protein [Kitasatospora sp. A2-31]
MAQDRPESAGPEAVDQGDLVRLTASGLVLLAQRDAAVLREGASPYPPVLQRVLNRLTLESWNAGRIPPQDMTDLVRWCRKPLKEWPFPLPDGLVAEDEPLVTEAGPTQLCLSLALSAGNPELEVVQNRLMGEAVRRCREQGLQAAYEALRRLCVREPILDARRWAKVQRTAVLEPVMDLVAQFYLPVPSALQVHGIFAACKSCCGLMSPRSRGGWICALDQCRLGGTWRRVGTRYAADKPLWMLRTALRLYTHGPGLAETQLEDALRMPGVVAVLMWPGVDLVDLLVVFADGTCWAIDVKDHANPDLLAEGLHRFPRGEPLPPYRRAIVAVPQYRIDRAHGYLERVRSLRPRAEFGFEVLSVDDVVRQAARLASRVSRSSHA